MGHEKAESGAEEAFSLKQEDGVIAHPERPVRRRQPRRVRRLGRVQAGANRINVWLEGGVLHFREHRGKYTATMSLLDAYHHASGQLELFRNQA